MNRFDLSTLPRCGAKTRSGEPCKRYGNKTNGRCKLHGGRSTGPRTKEGRKRCGAPHYQGKGRSRAWKEFKWAVRASADILDIQYPTEDNAKQRRTETRVERRIQDPDFIPRIQRALKLDK